MALPRPILVTGATGFIGQRCVEKLLQDGHRVRAFVLPNEPVSELFPTQVEIFRGDITRPEDVNMASIGVSGAIHLAALVTDAGTDELHQRVTVGGTSNVLAAAPLDIRVVVISSIVFYGTHLRSHTCYEDVQPGAPLGAYSRAKQAQEAVAKSYMKQGQNVTIVRPANVYGPNSANWVRDVAEHLRSGKPALVNGGKGNAGLVYVDNVVDVIVGALTTEAARGRAYNACDNLPVTWEDYFSDLAHIVDAPKPKSIPRWVASKGATLCEAVWARAGLKSRPLLTHEAVNLIGSDHRIPNRRAREELGVSPAVNYSDAMREIAQFFSSR